jgi:replication factor C subunit 3/5
LFSGKTEKATTMNQKTADHQSQIWIEKYRPQHLDDIISHRHIIQTLDQLIQNQQLPHMLFYGPAGTGKTSCILAVARKLFAKDRYPLSVLELNASDKRNISVVREQIVKFSSSGSLMGDNKDIKLVILDEVDHMTKDAQQALRRVIEKYTQKVRFCLICNFVDNVIPALQSRCMRFRFSPLAKLEIFPRLAQILDTENIGYDQPGLDAIARLSGGDMRKCLNFLQSVSTSFGFVSEENVCACTGNPTPSDMKHIVEVLTTKNIMDAYNEIHSIKTEKSYSLNDIIRELYPFVMRMGASKLFLIEQLSLIEYQLAFSSNEKIKTASLVGLFQVVRNNNQKKYKVNPFVGQ